MLHVNRRCAERHLPTAFGKRRLTMALEGGISRHIRKIVTIKKKNKKKTHTMAASIVETTATRRTDRYINSDRARTDLYAKMHRLSAGETITSK
jgi:hypothetical protein